MLLLMVKSCHSDENHCLSVKNRNNAAAPGLSSSDHHIFPIASAVPQVLLEVLCIQDHRIRIAGGSGPNQCDQSPMVDAFIISLEMTGVIEEGIMGV